MHAHSMKINHWRSKHIMYSNLKVELFLNVHFTQGDRPIFKFYLIKSFTGNNPVVPLEAMF